MSAIVDVVGVSSGDGFAANPGQPGDPTDGPQHYLDNAPSRATLAWVENAWIEARDAHAENRREMMIDADYYDCLQWRADDAAVLLDRGQAPLTFPIIKQMCDWLIGTERRTRIDWQVLPRKDSDVKGAQAKKEVLKWVSDVNGAAWERSKQFSDQVKVGVGWTEECKNNDRYEEPITIRHASWKNLWWDPYSTSNTMRDARYIHRAKWLDLDYAIAMFPDRADALRTRAVDNLDPWIEQLELEAALPQMFCGSQPHSISVTGSGVYAMGNAGFLSRRSRQRVLAIETWFKKAENVPLMMGEGAADFANKPFDPTNEAMQGLLASGTASLVDSVTEQIWVAIWTPGCLLRLSRSPYKHNRFPFTPAWAYRRHRDGMPYGAIRPARDAQDEYNKRRSKILFDLSTNRVIYEVDAMDEADLDRNLEEAQRPDGEIRLKSGAMKDRKFVVERGSDAVNGQVQMLAEAKANIYETSGVTRENVGSSQGDQSGRAILAKQQQGSVTSAELFDNFRQAIQESGQKTLSNCEQFLTMPKLIRILGPTGTYEWMGINQPDIDPMTGHVIWHNDITADEADFVVDETDYRETVRMAMAETLFELIGRLPPNVAMALLDIAVDMTDLPNKQDLVNRIRQVTGVAAPGTEDDPQVVAQKQVQEQQQAQAQQTAQAQAEANVDLTRAKTQAEQAKAASSQATAQHREVLGKAEAMTTAGMVRAAPELAPAADRIWDPTQAFPEQPNQYIPPEP